jgi:hypothetical protein
MSTASEKPTMNEESGIVTVRVIGCPEKIPETGR